MPKFLLSLSLLAASVTPIVVTLPAGAEVIRTSYDGFVLETHDARLAPLAAHVLSEVSAGAVKLKSATGGACTGTLLNREGYMLTNLHCLSQCLKDLDLSEKVAENEYFAITRVRDQFPENAICKSIHAEQKGKFFVGNPKIIALGRSFASAKSATLDKLTEEQWTGLAAALDDYAIVKFDGYKGAKFPAPCRQDLLEAGRNPTDGPYVISGFTGLWKYEDREFNLLMNYVVHTRSQAIFDGPAGETLLEQRHAEINDPARFLRLEAKIPAGFSGSMVYDQFGTPMALAYGVSPGIGNVLGATHALRLSVIRDELDQLRPGLVEQLRCR